MAALLAPRQLGYGVREGAEAAVHAARLYMQDLQHRSEIGLLECLQHSTQRQNASGSVELHAGSAPFCPCFLLITLLPLLD